MCNMMLLTATVTLLLWRSEAIQQHYDRAPLNPHDNKPPLDNRVQLESHNENKLRSEQKMRGKQQYHIDSSFSNNNNIVPYRLRNNHNNNHNRKSAAWQYFYPSAPHLLGRPAMFYHHQEMMNQQPLHSNRYGHQNKKRNAEKRWRKNIFNSTAQQLLLSNNNQKGANNNDYLNNMKNLPTITTPPREDLGFFPKHEYKTLNDARRANVAKQLAAKKAKQQIMQNKNNKKVHRKRKNVPQGNKNNLAEYTRVCPVNEVAIFVSSNKVLGELEKHLEFPQPVVPPYHKDTFITCVPHGELVQKNARDNNIDVSANVNNERKRRWNRKRKNANEDETQEVEENEDDAEEEEKEEEQMEENAENKKHSHIITGGEKNVPPVWRQTNYNSWSNNNLGQQLNNGEQSAIQLGDNYVFVLIPAVVDKQSGQMSMFKSINEIPTLLNGVGLQTDNNIRINANQMVESPALETPKRDKTADEIIASPDIIEAKRPAVAAATKNASPQHTFFPLPVPSATTAVAEESSAFLSPMTLTVILAATILIIGATCSIWTPRLLQRFRREYDVVSSARFV